MKLATIELIKDIQPIPGADNIDVATVLGYKTVVKKNEFKIGDLCIWHNPDTIVPEKPEYEFLRKNHFRLKVIRLKGQVSQGLALPNSLNGFKEGDDVTELVGIKKYEKPIPAQLGGKIKGNFPSFLIKTDEEPLRKYPELINEFKQQDCYITLKVDGSSGTFYYKDGVFGVCSRNLEILEDENNSFWKIAKKHNLKEHLEFHSKHFGNCAIQGEVYGPGINGNKLKVNELSLVVFNLFNIDKFVFEDFRELYLFCVDKDLPQCNLLYHGKFPFNTIEESIEYANNQTYKEGPAEGIVIRPEKNIYSNILGGRLSCKVLNEKFQLKHGE
ncbi:MAG: RNA ligase (ATP) [Nanoarchaeota archaeon]|mgnify:CR=1 FL=1